MCPEQGLTLKDKEARTLKIFDDLAGKYNLANIAVAWTGGKDSTVLLFLFKRYLESLGAERKALLKALNLDTGLKFAEVLQFRDELARHWDVDLQVIKPENQGPVAADPVTCCKNLKIEPLKKAIKKLGIEVLLTGLRRDEHPDRSFRQILEFRQNPQYVQANALLYWTEMDIWSFHLLNNLPYCCLYDQGYRSLGCRPCTHLPSFQGNERSGRAKSKEDKLDLLRSLGYF